METSRFLITVRLNSFVHRVEDKTRVMDCARAHQCQLKRIRRSRNWTLSGEKDQLVAFAISAGVGWISIAIDKALADYKSPIQRVLERNPEVTIAELIHESGCSLVEARAAIDEYEGL
ncbi:ribosome recycling factor family protein [Vibrio hangzhouensis]|uniref:Ribosome recycling factor n=1 Tax=Vibrio hangzhouensis TaxID=462991 RepID=A0A1H6C5I1_9VIBR|nr:ribosome recycling factor family protein [Vibrio hangzhouensis]SEG68188.1 Ribosome recycling factor [Vibrio hangzhouensis]